MKSFPFVDIPEISDEEQAEIDEALKNPECWEFGESRIIEIDDFPTRPFDVDSSLRSE